MDLDKVKPFFDGKWYLSKYSDVMSAGFDAWDHYQQYGHKEGRIPCALEAFDLEKELWSSETSSETLSKLHQLVDTTHNPLELTTAFWVLGRWYASVRNWPLTEKYIKSLLEQQFSQLLFPQAASWLLLFSAYYHLGKFDAASMLLDNSKWPENSNKQLALSMLLKNREKVDVLNLVWKKSELTLVNPKDNENLSLDRLKEIPSQRHRSIMRFFYQRKKVTVIIPCYNAELTISTALESLIQQTWSNLEVLVVDDCSTDSSVNVIEAFSKKDSRIRLIKHQRNQGAYVARNTALKEAKGDFITVHDSDDWSHPDKIKVQVEALLKNKHLKASISHWVRCDSELNFERWRMEDGWVFRNTSALMFRASLVNEIGFWDCVSISADTEYYYRIQKVYGPSSIKEVFPGVPLSFGRVDPGSLTQQSKTNLRTLFSGVRKDYHDAALAWQKANNPSQLYLPKSPKKRPFPVPSLICRGRIEQRAHNDELIIGAHHLFDKDWYTRRYPDVIGCGLTAIEHYCIHGSSEGRDPSPFFSSTGYRYTHGLEASVNPLVHLIEHNHNDYSGVMSGELPFNNGGKVILLYGHAAGEQLFGAERSLINLLDLFASLKVNVITCLPAAHNYEYLDSIRKHCHAICITPYQWWRSLRAVDEAVVSKFVSLVNEYSVDAIYCNTSTLFEPFIAAKQLNIPSFMHLRELPNEHSSLLSAFEADQGNIVQHISSLADHYVANSYFVSSFFEDALTAEVLYNFLPNECFVPLNISKNGPLKVGLISSNEINKGVLDFFKISSHCISNSCDIEFYLYGPVTQIVKDELDKGLPKNVSVMGYVSQPSHALESIDVLLNLSYVEETFGRTVLEAMAHKRCVVAYANGALPELVKDQSGYLVSLGDMDGICDILKTLSKDRARLEQMCESAYEFSYNHFRLDVVRQQVLSSNSSLRHLIT